MNKPVQEAADRALDKAISADEQANTYYYQILRRFTSSKPDIPGGKLRQPEAKLDANGLKEISIAWLKLQNTEKKLRSAYMKLYEACI